MTTAVLVAMVGAGRAADPAALLRTDGGTLLGRLGRQLLSAGAEDLVVLTRPEWGTNCKQALEDAGLRGGVREARDLAEVCAAVAEVAASATGSVVVAQAEIVTHDGAIAGLLADPRVSSGILATAWSKQEDEFGVRIERGRAVSAESPFHATSRPAQRFLGLMKIGPADREALAEAARSASRMCRGELPSLWEAEFRRKVETVWGRRFFTEGGAGMLLADRLRRMSGRPPWMPDPIDVERAADDVFHARVVHRAEAARVDATSLLLVALVRSEVTLRVSYLRELYWARPLSQEAVDRARAALRQVDEDAVLLRSAVKAEDGFFTTFFVSPYSKYIARWAARSGFTPNQVTVVSLVLGLVAALEFAIGTPAGLIAGAVLLQVSFTADCVDGQLARYTRRFSGLGAWLDSVFDRTKEYAVYAGLAYGGTRAAPDDSIWVLAGAAIAVQTVRHMLDFSFAATQHGLIASVGRVPLEQPWDSASHAAALRLGETDLEEHDAEEEGGADARGGIAQGLRGALRRLGNLGVETSRRFERESWMKFVKRIIVFPIGERFAAISLAAAIAGPRTVFVVLLAWGAVAGLYSATGRVLRSFATERIR